MRRKMKFAFLGCVVAAVLLDACGGGSSTLGTGAFPTTSPTQAPTQAPVGISGVVVDDATGKPLAGVHVALAPWMPSATPMPGAITDATGTFLLPPPTPGHYLLVEHLDSTHADVHDNVTIKTSTQKLRAPALPPVGGYAPPAWETNGDYRLAPIDQETEATCLSEFNAARAANGLPGVIEDEWLLENSRAKIAWYTADSPQPFWSTWINPFATTGYGGPNSVCQDAVNYAFTDRHNRVYSLNPHTLWFGGFYSAAIGLSFLEFPVDPRENGQDWI